MLARKWRDSVLDSMCRRATHDPEGVVHRRDLIDHELDQIVAESEAHGRTPEQTMSNALQRLRDEGVIEFLGRGKYRVL